MKKRAADIAIQTLINCGIDTCFCVVGGGAMHLNNAFALQKENIRMVYCHHEQACAMAAEGYARYSGHMAAVCVTSGPGGINALNGVQGAWVDSIPMIVLSGHPRYETTVPASGLKLRWRGVQENNIIRMVAGITKYAKQVLKPEQLQGEIEKAVDIAMDGRRGPVWIDIPLDVQGGLVEEGRYAPCILRRKDRRKGLGENIERMERILKEAKRPCILTGSGIRCAGAEEAFRRFTENVRIPIVGGALRADINAAGDTRYYGMSGVIGPRTGNFILQSADVILVLGNSLSTAQTGFNQKEFAKYASIVMVDADGEEMKKPGLHVQLPICADLGRFFTECLERGLSIDAPQEWVSHCEMLKSSFPAYEMLMRHGAFSNSERVPALLFWKDFLEQLEDDAVLVLGNSDSCLGVLQEGIRSHKQRVLVNYNSGSMGDDLPPAVGAAAASGKNVYCITGDGSIMLNIQELETIVYYGYPVKIVIMNNEGYGTIRNTCTNFFQGLYAGCNADSGLGFPDFERVADAFRIPYRRCVDIGGLNEGIQWLVGCKGVCMLEIMERIDEISGPSVSSVMDENGVFQTPPLHIMSPLLPEGELEHALLGSLRSERWP